MCGRPGGGGYNFAKLPYRDVTTNTDLTPARISSPNFGRWFSPDPIGKAAVQLADPQTWNMYAYVRNNPTTLTDPNGTCAITCYNPLGGMTEVVNDVPQEPEAAGQTEVEESVGHVVADPTVAAQEQQKQTVVYSENANPAVTRGQGGAEREVYHRAAEIDPNGTPNTQNTLKVATLTLHEEMDPRSKDPDQLIAKKPQPQTGDEYDDYQYVKPGQQYRVLRDWKVNDQPAMVYDKATKQTYHYEVTTLGADSKTPISTQYTNKPPF
jgi:RHS repeat-associated protein